MIDLKGKNKYVIKAIEAAGHSVWTHDLVQSSTDDVAVQAIVDAYNVLPELKLDKIKDLKAEGLTRIQLTFPAVSDFDELDLIREQYLSVAPAARQATTDFQRMIDIVQAGKSARTEINALTLEAEAIAYDVVNTPNWPV